MDAVTLARALHVLGVVVWIGGVAMVTAVILPAVRSFKSPEESLAFFETVEHRFSWIARIATLLVGATGFYMAWQLDLWSRFTDPSYWWMHAMVAVWAVFTFLLFVAEPLILRRRLAERARKDPRTTFARIQLFHWILLALSLVTVAGAVAGAHGLAWFR